MMNNRKHSKDQGAPLTSLSSLISGASPHLHNHIPKHRNNNLAQFLHVDTSGDNIT